MAAKHKCGVPRSAEPGQGQGSAGEAEEETWAGPQATEVVVYDRERDRERALGGGRRGQEEEEEEEEEDEDEEGPEGYHCQICGYHAEQLQPFNVHLHTAHPAVVLRELYGLLGLPGCPGPGLFGAPIPGLGVTLGPGPSPVGGPGPGLGLAGGPTPGLGLTGGPVPALTGGPISTGGPVPGLGLTGGPVPALTGGPSPIRGPVPGLGLTGGPVPALTGGPSPTGGPVPGLGLTVGPRPIQSGGPHPGPGPSLTRAPQPEHVDGSCPIPSGRPGMGPTGGCPVPGLSLSRGPTPRPGRRDVVRIDLTGEGARVSPEPPASASPPASPPSDPELEAGGPLAESFSRFPYPSPAELARCGLSAGLPAERVRVWFAVQRLRHGISWTPEEVREARDKLRRGRGGAAAAVGPLPDPRPSRRCRKTKGQLAALRSSFSRGPYPDPAETRRLQDRTGLGRAEIRRWFSDSRYQRRRGPAGPPLRRRDGGEEEAGGAGTPGTSHRRPRPRPRAPALGRPRKSKEQLAVLKGFFLRCRWPSGEDYGRLAHSTGLARADIIQWFGDTRYALKNGQLKWVHRGPAGLAAVAAGGAGDRGRRRRRTRPPGAEGERPGQGGEGEGLVVGNGTSGRSALGLAL